MAEWIRCARCSRAVAEDDVVGKYMGMCPQCWNAVLTPPESQPLIDQLRARVAELEGELELVKCSYTVFLAASGASNPDAELERCLSVARIALRKEEVKRG